MSPILSVGSSDNDNPSSMTQVSHNSIGESSDELADLTDDEPIYFTRSLFNVSPKPGELTHFVCQTNVRPKNSHFLWRLNGRCLTQPRTLVTG